MHWNNQIQRFFIFLLLLFVNMSAIARQQEFIRVSNDKKSQNKISLREAFQTFEKIYKINIVYEETSVKDKIVSLGKIITNDLNKDLSRLLAAYSLNYEKVGSKTYVIVDKSGHRKIIISGSIVDDHENPLTNANVFLAGTSFGASSDKNGGFVIQDVPEGTHTLVAQYVGYKTQHQILKLAAKEPRTVRLKLQRDILDFDAIIVTGTRTPKTKLESSIAITTVDLEEISTRAPQNTADLLKAVPGFYIESSGGEGGNNLFARGMPSDGSYRYVSLQEDGLPVFEDSELMFANADIFLRVDETTRIMEGLRGGTGSIFASNAPGGIINFISKTGSEKLAGIVKLTFGDYSLYRTDFNVGGPFNENWRFNIGGFYRYDEGIRDPGFPANKGGQVKFNITRLLNNGYVRFNAKFLNDRNVFYQPIPLQDKSSPRGISGFDPNYGTLTSNDANYISISTPKGEHFEEYLDEGMHPRLMALGGETLLGDGEGFSFKNSFRYTQINQKFNAIFSLSDPFFIDTFADSVAGISNWQYQYAHSGEIISEPIQLNGNGLVAEVGWWSVKMPMNNFANSAQITKSFNKNEATLGHYFSTYSVRPFWFWHNLLVEVADQPKALDLLDLDNGVSYTKNGFTRYGSFYSNFQMDGFVNALYFVDEFQVTDNFRIDVGLRFEMGKFKGQVENIFSANRYDAQNNLIADKSGNPIRFGYDLGDPTTAADDNVLYGDGTFRPYQFDYNELAFSSGVHYAINKNAAIFTRGSRGFRTPDDQHFVFFEAGSYKIERVLQFEGGIKYSSSNFAFFSTFFVNNFRNLPFSDEVVDPNSGDIVRAFRFADSRTIGLEIEAVSRFKGLNIDITATLQDPKYLNYEFIGSDEDFSNRQVRRIPKIFFNMLMSHQIGRFEVHSNLSYFGKRFTDDANTGVLPAYTLLNAVCIVSVGQISIALNGSNLLNTIGLTEGNPRVDNTVDPRNFFFLARPVLGRAFTASFGYNF